ncbi:sporulation domain protein [Mizugakiibacter sediminis]|uniref:Sporulation domain protein n=1 Tax=Mizugakiibacter sediminis TaxID=1475481 RepID=A0A0K8QLB1_9GAMM|nr:SPOR domain-containing protein [Mizugakiibacter sediminis]GAP65720.1 sporulation domain protein [Mizugakiibacter sediminis]
MEPALKQRLLGAAVLIALAIIFVPMFFSGEPPKSAGQDTTVSLDIPPAPDRELQSRTLAVAPEGLPAPAASAPAPAAPAGIAAADKVTTVEVQSRKPADVHPENDTASAAPAPAAEPANPPAAAPPTPAPPAPKSAPAVKPAVSSAPGAAAGGRYAVSLGVYGDRANAQALLASARKLGLPARGEAAEVNGKAATRVSLGPFEDRAAAEAARLKFKGAEPKVPAAVVAYAADQAADAPAAALPANRAGAWAVQLGAFATQEEALKLRDRLRTAGFDAFVDDVAAGGGKLWRVRVGPQAQRGGAETLRDQIAAKVGIKGIVVTQP